MTKLSDSQARVLKNVHTGSGPMLWGDGHHSSVAASAFYRTVRSLEAKGLVEGVPYNDRDSATGYRRRLTDEGKALLLSLPTWRHFRALRDAALLEDREGVTVAGIPKTTVDAWEESFERLLNEGHDLTNENGRASVRYAVARMTANCKVDIIRSLAAAYSIINNFKIGLGLRPSKVPLSRDGADRNLADALIVLWSAA